MSDDAGYSDDDEAAVYDTAALHTLEQLVSHAADRGLLRGEGLEDARSAVAQLRTLVEAWHGTGLLDLFGDTPAGLAR